MKGLRPPHLLADHWGLGTIITIILTITLGLVLVMVHLCLRFARDTENKITLMLDLDVVQIQNK